MNKARRLGLKLTGAAGVYSALLAIGLRPGEALAAMDEAFGTKGVKGTLEAMGAADVSESDQIVLKAPDIAENGAVVPIRITSNLPKTEMIALLVEKNPNALAGVYEMVGDINPAISLRIKMGQTSDVVAVVKADGKYHMTKKEIKVTLGGCGG